MGDPVLAHTPGARARFHDLRLALATPARSLAARSTRVCLCAPAVQACPTPPEFQTAAPGALHVPRGLRFARFVLRALRVASRLRGPDITRGLVPSWSKHHAQLSRPVGQAPPRLPRSERSSPLPRGAQGGERAGRHRRERREQGRGRLCEDHRRQAAAAGLASRSALVSASATAGSLSAYRQRAQPRRPAQTQRPSVFRHAPETTSPRERAEFCVGERTVGPSGPSSATRTASRAPPRQSPCPYGC